MQKLAGLSMRICVVLPQFDPDVWFFRERPIIKAINQLSDDNKGDFYGTPEQVGVAG